MSKFPIFREHGISNTVEVQNWFAGFITKSTAEKEGEYLVHIEEKMSHLKFILSVRGKKECNHFTITNKNEIGWTLDANPDQTFDTIIDLIQYYKNNTLPVDTTFLIDPFQKPKWFIRHENITYDPETGLIGAGNFCDVFEGKLYGKISVALKLCHGQMDENISLEEANKLNDTKESLMREACLMSQFKHPNIVKFHGICYDVPTVCIIMERCTGGSLDNHLQQWASKISIGERILYSLEAAKGMCYLQEHDLIHRDLATRNCLISKYGTIKISDFGLSQSVSDVIATSTKQRVPVRWMAPETIQREPRYSVKSDVWSYGVLLYEIFNNGMKPWPDLDIRQCATNIRHGIMPDMPEMTPKEIIRLVNKCWRMNVEKRCDFKYIVRKLKKIQIFYGPLKITNLTIAKLKNVKCLTEEEAEMEEEKNEYEIQSMWKARSRTAPIKKEELERRRQRRQREDEAAILNEFILEYVTDEIKKLLSSKRKRKQKHKHKRKHDEKHRRSRRKSETSFSTQSEGFSSKKSFSKESEIHSKKSETLSKESITFLKEKVLSKESDKKGNDSCQVDSELTSGTKRSENESAVERGKNKQEKDQEGFKRNIEKKKVKNIE